MSIPTLRMNAERSPRLRAGSPWIFANELGAQQTQLEPGTVVRIANNQGHALGLFHYNPRSLIAARKLSSNSDRPIDAAWFAARFKRADTLRQRVLPGSGPRFDRLVHGEADGLPGLIIDRFDDALVIQCNTAGMDRLVEPITEALTSCFQPRHILFRNDSPVRSIEGLEPQTFWAAGGIEVPVTVQEHGVRFQAELATGQKTGWYFDQRDNRRLLASLTTDRRMLDLYSYTGGFGLAAAAAGARQCLMIDSSKAAIGLARSAAANQSFAGLVDFEAADGFKALAQLKADKSRFDVISADPPPFARSKKDVPAALKAYRKLASQTADVAGEGAIVALSCCSHNINTDAILKECNAGIRQSGRAAQLLTIRGADLDHPTHPALPETAYLRFLLFQLD